MPPPTPRRRAGATRTEPGPPPVRAIVTRPEPQAGQWVRALQGRGVDAAALPLIAIEPAADTAPLRAAWAALAEQALVMYVSPTAVLQFHAHAPAGAGFPPSTLAASPGPGTQGSRSGSSA